MKCRCGRHHVCAFHLGVVPDPDTREKGYPGLTSGVNLSTGSTTTLPMTDAEKADAASREKHKKTIGFHP